MPRHRVSSASTVASTVSVTEPFPELAEVPCLPESAGPTDISYGPESADVLCLSESAHSSCLSESVDVSCVPESADGPILFVSQPVKLKFILVSTVYFS